MLCPYPLNIQKHGQPDPRVRLEVPCGKCHICQNNRRTEWTIRLTEEAKEHHKMCFVTLTYDENNLPYGQYVNTLDKRDLQLFFKRLRKTVSPKKIRYYAVGEYGSKSIRAHYHALLFGLDKDDDETIQKSWQLGNIHIGNINEKSIKYVTKYHVNRGSAPLGSQKEYVTMSTKPPIGFGYLSKMAKQHQGVEKPYYQNKQFKQRLPRYYKDRLYTKQQRDIIAAKSPIEKYDQQEYESYKKKHPNGNYFRYIQQRTEENKRRFIDKNQKNQIL